MKHIVDYRYNLSLLYFFGSYALRMLDLRRLISNDFGKKVCHVSNPNSAVFMAQSPCRFIERKCYLKYK